MRAGIGGQSGTFRRNWRNVRDWKVSTYCTLFVEFDIFAPLGPNLKSALAVIKKYKKFPLFADFLAISRWTYRQELNLLWMSIRIESLTIHSLSTRLECSVRSRFCNRPWCYTVTFSHNWRTSAKGCFLVFLPRLLALIDGWNISYFKIYPADSLAFFQAIVMNVIGNRAKSKEVRMKQCLLVKAPRKDNFRKEWISSSCFSILAIRFTMIKTTNWRMARISWSTWLINLMSRFRAGLRLEVKTTIFWKGLALKKCKFQAYPTSKFAALLWVLCWPATNRHHALQPGPCMHCRCISMYKLNCMKKFDAAVQMAR